MANCSICSNYIKKDDYRIYCCNCDAEICEDCESDNRNMIHGDQYCNVCFNEIGGELENPDLGDDGYHNQYGQYGMFNSLENDDNHQQLQFNGDYQITSSSLNMYPGLSVLLQVHV